MHAAGVERDIHTEPFDHGRWEQAVHTHTAGHAPAPTTGGILGTTAENAALVRAQTEKVGQAVAAVAQAIDLLNDAVNTAVGALGETAGSDVLNARVQGVINVLDSANGEVMSLNDAFETAATSGG